MGVVDLLAVAGFVVFWIVLLAVAARRMLELRVGPLRLVFAGAAGVAAYALALGQRVQGEGWPFVFLWVGIGLLAAMGVLIVGEAVAPAGTRPRPIRWYRAFRGWRRRTRAVRADQPDRGTPRAWHLHDGGTQPHPAAAV